MKKYAFAFFLVLFTASVGLAMAAYQSDSKAQKAKKTVSGEIVSVDASAKQVVIKDSDGNEVSLKVTDSTKITKGGKTVALADLKAGDKVTGEAEESDSGLVATQIAG